MLWGIKNKIKKTLISCHLLLHSLFISVFWLLALCDAGAYSHICSIMYTYSVKNSVSVFILSIYSFACLLHLSIYGAMCLSELLGKVGVCFTGLVDRAALDLHHLDICYFFARLSLSPCLPCLLFIQVFFFLSDLKFFFSSLTFSLCSFGLLVYFIFSFTRSLNLERLTEKSCN